ncbi:venom protease-like [Topomyia yanbarensis]|uniref:venom protease-like n=1 Tax=Topomyia yanbarensis TaxID=2498891 RepID=UPI00273CE27D|nr:venom protease-like [Topomyia yanbarensis]
MLVSWLIYSVQTHHSIMKNAILYLLLVTVVSVTATFAQQFRSFHRTRKPPASWCGVRKITSRGLIVGGSETIPGEWPWHAAVYHVTEGGRSREYKCGGTLINSGYLLTTASCALYGRGKPEGAIVVELGQFNLVESFAGKVDAIVSNVSIHEQYVHGETMNDVAVMQLKNAVQFTDYVQPACLPVASENIEHYEGKNGTIVGWGFEQAGKLSEKLKTAQVPVISYLQCLKSDRDFFSRNLNSGMFCAGLLNGTAPCFGDAGGGMFFQNGKVWILRGIIAFTGRVYTETGGCNTEQYFGLVNVIHFMPWIEETIARWNASIVPAVVQNKSQQQRW